MARDSSYLPSLLCVASGKLIKEGKRRFRKSERFSQISNGTILSGPTLPFSSLSNRCWGSQGSCWGAIHPPSEVAALVVNCRPADASDSDHPQGWEMEGAAQSSLLLQDPGQWRWSWLRRAQIIQGDRKPSLPYPASFIQGFYSCLSNFFWGAAYEKQHTDICR